MTSNRQQKKKAKSLADKQAKANAPGESKFAKEPLAGIAPEDSNVQEIPLQAEPANNTAENADEAPLKDKKKKEQEQASAQPAEESPEQIRLRRKKCADQLNELFEIRSIDPLLHEKVDEVTHRQDKRLGDVIDIKVCSGKTVHYYKNFAGQGYEFIGVTGAEPLDPEATVATAKSKGWTKIKLHGSAEVKNELWLECMRQGVDTDYQPPEGAKVWKEWEKIYDGSLDKNISGVRQEATEAPAADVSTPAAETPEPAAASRFTKPAAPETPAEGTPFSQHLAEKAEAATNPTVKNGLLKMKALHDGGVVKLSLNETFVIQSTLEEKGYDAAAAAFEQASNPMKKEGGGVKLPRTNPTGKKTPAPV